MPVKYPFPLNTRAVFVPSEILTSLFISVPRCFGGAETFPALKNQTLPLPRQYLYIGWPLEAMDCRRSWNGVVQPLPNIPTGTSGLLCPHKLFHVRDSDRPPAKPGTA